MMICRSDFFKFVCQSVMTRILFPCFAELVICFLPRDIHKFGIYGDVFLEWREPVKKIQRSNATVTARI